MDAAEQHLLQDLTGGVAKLKREIGYNPTYLMGTLAEHGAAEASRRLIRSRDTSDGFTRLWEADRLCSDLLDPCTHRQSFATFAFFDLLNLRLSPQIAKLAEKLLWRTREAERYQRWPKAGTLLRLHARTDLGTEHWDDLLRVGSSLKLGHVSAALLGAGSRPDRASTLSRRPWSSKAR